MRSSIRQFLSLEANPLAQFVKYGVVGVMSTLVQMVIFYLLASCWLQCLSADDGAVRHLGLPAATFTGREAWYATRGMLAAVDTAIGFAVANVFCWLMNRKFVFKAGKFRWYVEFLMFFGVAGLATLLAIGLMKVLIDVFGVTSSVAFAIEVVVSFLINFFVRKFVIFKR